MFVNFGGKIDWGWHMLGTVWARSLVAAISSCKLSDHWPKRLLENFLTVSIVRGKTPKSFTTNKDLPMLF